MDSAEAFDYRSVSGWRSAPPTGGKKMPKFAWMLLLFVTVAMPSMHGSPAEAQSAPTYVNAVDLDIVPAEREKYIEAIKDNGAASVKEPGCRQFDIAVSASDPNHFFLYEVYDNEAAYKAHRETDHFKKYAAATANMVAKRNPRQMTPIAFNSKGH
jgi:(4S)-4-hydroxy-5-phosphonooxypentane-2,3-dione isomerase